MLDVEEKVEKEVTFNDILFFASVCKVMPPFGTKLSLNLSCLKRMVKCPNSQKLTHVLAFFIYLSPTLHMISLKKPYRLYFSTPVVLVSHNLEV